MTTKKADKVETEPQGTGKPVETAKPVAPYPGSLPGHPDATYCPDCGRIAVGDLVHGPHEKAKK